MTLLELAVERARQNQRIVDWLRPRTVPVATFLYAFTGDHGGAVAYSDVVYLN